MRVSEQDVQDASRQVDAARTEAVAASSERSAVLSEAFTKGLAKLKSSRSSTGSTSSSFEQLGQTLNRLDQITRSVADSTGDEPVASRTNRFRRLWSRWVEHQLPALETANAQQTRDTLAGFRQTSRYWAP